MAGETLKSESTIWLFGRDFTELTPPNGKQLARIFAFAFHNEFFELGAPALFVLDKSDEKVGKNPGAELTGLGVPPRLAEDLTVWKVDLDDVSTRLDMMSGRFSRILLDVELVEEGLQDLVRGGGQLGAPASLGEGRRGRRGRWRSNDD